MPRRENQNPAMEESPLMHKAPGTLNSSTIHPERMDQSRFTEIRDLEDEKTNPVRIIIYAIIIIVIGVGAAFLVRTLISNNQQTNENTQQNQQQNENTTPVSAFVISLTPKSDTMATNLAANDDYVDSETVTLGDSALDMTNVELSSIRYDRFTTFSRTTFDFSGNTNKLPKSTLNFNANNNALTVAFQDLTKIHEDLLVNKNINDIIGTITYDTTNSLFTIRFTEDAKYRVTQTGGDLIIDVKTLEQLGQPETQTPVANNNEEETPQQTPPANNDDSDNQTDTSKPAAPHYTNSFSKNKQYLSSNVTGNTLGFNNFWIWDEGSFIEFSIGQTNVVGEQYTPNVTAYLETESGKNYLYLEVENLSNAPFSQTKTRTLQNLIETSGASIDPATVNFVQIDLVSFTGGKATYKIELKRSADYKLLSQKTYDNTTQIVSVQIKD